MFFCDLFGGWLSLYKDYSWIDKYGVYCWGNYNRKKWYDFTNSPYKFAVINSKLPINLKLVMPVSSCLFLWGILNSLL